MEENRNIEIGKTIKQFLLWCLLYIAPIIIGCIAVHFTKNFEILGWTMLLGYLFISILYFGKRYVKLSFGRIEKHMVWPMVGISVLVATAYSFILVSVLNLIDIEHLIPKEIESVREGIKSLPQGTAGLLCCCILVPIVEEIGFRGIFLDGLLKSRCRPWVAIIITALLFGVLHGYAVKSIICMAMGIIVGWLYWRTDSVIPGIIFHVVNNSLCCLDLSFIDLSSRTALLIILVASSLVFALGLWWFGKKCNFADEIKIN